MKLEFKTARLSQPGDWRRRKDNANRLLDCIVLGLEFFYDRKGVLLAVTIEIWR